MSDRTCFWVVWCREHGAPTVLHSERETAVREAERLASQNHGREFFVLRAESVSKHRAVDTVSLVEADNPW